jgi:SAM-dependent methyltransferase
MSSPIRAIVPSPSADYYEDHAEAFFAETVNVDMTPLYDGFLSHVPAGGVVLDAGCGAARDALAFRRLGYQVEAFDASPALAALAEAHLGQPVAVLRVEDLDRQGCFDGIWACASLLHVQLAGLPEVLARLAAALKPGGVLYVSFKYGRGEREHGGRRFTDLDEAGFAELLRMVPALVQLETWVTADRRPDRGDRWLNVLLTTKPAASQ